MKSSPTTQSQQSTTQRGQINEWFNLPTSGMTAHVDMRHLARGLPLPLHPGAKAYYREKGYV
jgi:TRAP-type uncharacterized transport system substrate-binding protein